MVSFFIESAEARSNQLSIKNKKKNKEKKLLLSLGIICTNWTYNF